MVDPSSRRRSKSSDQRGNWDDKGPSFRKGNSIGVNVTTARNHYSLAPCSHLFVSRPFFFPECTEPILNLLFYNSTLNVWKRSVPDFVSFKPLISRRSYIIYFYSVACNQGIFCSNFSVERTLMLLLVEHLSAMPQTITTALGHKRSCMISYGNVVIIKEVHNEDDL